MVLDQSYSFNSKFQFHTNDEFGDDHGSHHQTLHFFWDSFINKVEIDPTLVKGLRKSLHYNKTFYTHDSVSD